MWIRIVMTMLGAGCLWLTMPAEADTPEPATVPQQVQHF